MLALETEKTASLGFRVSIDSGTSTLFVVGRLDVHTTGGVWQKALLTRSGRFHNVIDGSGPAKTSQILEATVTALYGDYRVHPPRAVLGLDFFLVGEAPDFAEIMWHREYREEVPLTKESPGRTGDRMYRRSSRSLSFPRE
jgi:hypothetical protein